VKLRDDEVWRLIAYLRLRVSTEELAQIEDILRSDEGTDYLRRRALLRYFPPIETALPIANVKWLVRITSHAHLRLIQRGVTVDEIQRSFVSFVEGSFQTGELVIEGNYALVGQTRWGVTTVQIEVERITDAEGEANVVTIYLGRPSQDENAITVEWM
jgi:hypothetical protein